LRIVYFGTPVYAVPTLERLNTDDRFSVELVVTQPDRPAGRGRKQSSSAVKQAAEKLGLPIYQPESLKSPNARAPLVDVGADLFVVAAFGLIFGTGTLSIPRLGCLNLHASILPKYRGASPVPAAILRGDVQTGVTLMVMERGLDTGPIVATATQDISPGDTTESLTQRLSVLAAQFVPDDLASFAAGDLAPVEQPATGVSIVRPLTSADGWLDWRRPAVTLERQIRAMWPWPRAWTTLNGDRLQIHRASVLDWTSGHPGELWGSRNAYAVSCAIGSLALDVVQPAGGKTMSGAALVTGRRVIVGDHLGMVGAPEPGLPLIVDLDDTARSGD
jgi:methionyl-tRNA formyltransferase